MIYQPIHHRRSYLLFLACLTALSLLTSLSPTLYAQPTPEEPANRTLNDTIPEKDGELRGLWVVRDSLISRASIRQVVTTAVKYNLNAIFVQARGRGDAWYVTDLVPRAELLANAPADFDPLKEIIEEGHKAGLEVHVWLNTYLTWSGKKTPRDPNHLWNAHRDWFATDRNGKVSPIPTSKAEGAFLQPSNPAVQEHLYLVFLEVATRYDLDGIHFDYCRYPGSSYDFSPGTLARFRTYMLERIEDESEKHLDSRLKTNKLAYVHAYRKDWETWRRDQITSLVSRIGTAVRTAKPWVKVSAAVFANAHDAYTDKGQDWKNWIQTGILDAVALMAYDYDTKRIVSQTKEAVAIAEGRHVYTGIGAWRLQAHDVAKKIDAVRKAGASGVNLFSYDNVRTRPRYLETLKRGVFASRSAPAKMRWVPPKNAPTPDKEEPVRMLP